MCNKSLTLFSENFELWGKKKKEIVFFLNIIPAFIILEHF